MFCVAVGGGFPPLFYDLLLPHDVMSLRFQVAGRRFDLSLVLGVAARCRRGMPQVVLSAPFGKREPFPTTFWLVCPFLAGRCGFLENGGGVTSLENFLASRRREWTHFHLRHVLMRLALLEEWRRRFLFTRRTSIARALRSGGAGGIALREKIFVKCLHLQVASLLALRDHPGAEWFAEYLPERECGEACVYPCARRQEGKTCTSGPST